MNDKLKKIIWEYFDTSIPGRGWKWVSLSMDSDIHYLFVDNHSTIINLHPTHKYDAIPCHIFGEYFVYHSILLDNLVYVFGEENSDISKKLFLEWVSKNIPLDVTKTDCIGGISRKNAI